MSNHRFHADSFDADWLRKLRRDAKDAAKAFEEHWDGCRTCVEGAWNNELCIEGAKLMKKSKALHEQLNEADGD